MRFRVECTNPESRRRHEFEVRGDSAHEVEYRLREQGLVATKVTPLQDHPQRPRLRVRPSGLTRAGIVKRIVAYAMLAATVTASLAAALVDLGTPLPPRLDASVEFDGYQFRIANTSGEPWRDVRLDINGGLTSRGYVLELGTLDPDLPMVFPASAFRNPDGAPFNPITERLVQLRITGTLPDGTGAIFARRW